jgi:hypothetical protein
MMIDLIDFSRIPEDIFVNIPPAVLATFAVREVDGMNSVDLKQNRNLFRQEKDRGGRNTQKIPCAGYICYP